MNRFVKFPAAGGGLCLGAAFVILLSSCAKQPTPQPIKQPGERSEQPAAENQRGLVSLDEPAQRRSDYHAKWAVIIGIDAYPAVSGFRPLEYAGNDARELRELLGQEFGFDEAHVKYFQDAEATRANITAALADWLSKQSIGVEDAVFVFYAGHGLADANDGYLAAVDSVAGDPGGTCLRLAGLRQMLAALPCRHKLLILDSCYSGALFRRSTSTAGTTLAQTDSQNSRSGGAIAANGGNSIDESFDNFNYYFQHTAFLGMSAGREQPVADGSGAGRHSVFTAKLLQALRDRVDSPRGDHAFTFRALAAEVERRVASAKGSHQVPDWGNLDETAGQGDFVFRPLQPDTRKTPSERASEVESLAEQFRARLKRRPVAAALRFASTEREQLEALAESRTLLEDYLVSTGQAELAADEVYQQVMTLKGYVLAHQRELRRLRDLRPTESGPSFDELNETVAALVHASAREPSDEQAKQIEALVQRRDQIEASLTALYRYAVREALPPATVADLRKVLGDHGGPDTVLIDFLILGAASPGEPQATNLRPQLIAFIVSSDQLVQQVDLGDPVPIATLVAEFRRNQFESGQELRQRLWVPIERRLPGKPSLIVIAPDGFLSRLPFAAIPGSEAGKFLLENYAFSTISAPQLLPALLAGEGARNQPPSLCTVGDIDFSAASEGVAPTRGAAGASPKAEAQFSQLPETRGEIIAVRHLFEEFAAAGGDAPSKSLRSAAASEAAFRSTAPRCRYLHVASHSFAPNADRPSATMHPAIALAGANAPSDDPMNDGWLTGLEIACMDWRKTELVVATCDTAAGLSHPAEESEGVMRGFHIAGVSTVITALGSVREDTATSIVRGFYENLWERRLSKVEALRQAQLAVLHRPAKAPDDENFGPVAGRARPQFWAPFILSGDWR